jgi:hypothetical protein
MSDGQVLIQVVTDAKNLDELRQGLKQWKDELSTSDFGSAQFDIAKQRVGEFKGAIKDATSTGQGMHETYFQLGTIIRQVGVAWMEVQAVMEAFKGAEVAAQFDLINSTLDQLAHKDGMSAVAILDQIREKTHGTISEFDMAKAALKFNMQDVPFAQIPEVMQLADERAKLFGVDFETASNAILQATLGRTQGLKRQLDISVDAKAAEENYATSLGITADQLSEVGKKHAILNGILTEANRQNIHLNENAMEAVDTWERMKVSLSNLALAFGHLLGVFAPIVSAITWVVDLLKLSIEEIGLFSKMAYDAMTMHFNDAADDLVVLNAKAAEVMAKLKEGWKGVTASTKDNTAATKDNTNAQNQHHVALIQGSKEDVDSAKVAADAQKKKSKDIMDAFNADIANMRKHNQDIKQILDEDAKNREAYAKKEAQSALQTGEAIGSSMAQGIEQGVPVLHAAYKSILVETLNFIKKQLTAAILENTISNFATLGPLGLIAGAAQAAIINAAFDVAAADIKSFAGGGIIYEPVLGRGLRTGATYTIAERGPEMVSPMIHDGRYGGGTGSGEPYVRVFPIANNQQIAVMVEYGQRAIAQRRIG